MIVSTNPSLCNNKIPSTMVLPRIETTNYRKRTYNKPSRKIYDTKRNIYKKTSNDTASELLDAHLSCQTINSAILDGAYSHNTSRMLYKNHDVVNITVIEQNPRFHDKHLKFGLDSRNQTFEEFMQEPPEQKYNFIYADFEGTIRKHGDIHDLFRRGFADNKIVIGTTFNARSTIKGTNFNEEFEEWENEFINSARCAGYKLIDQADENYYCFNHNTMRTNFYVFQKK